MTPSDELLFGLFAVQAGAVDADQMAEALARWSADRTVTLADRLLSAGSLTLEQKTLVETLVAQELKNHNDNAEATLATEADGRFIDAVGKVNPELGAEVARLAASVSFPWNYEWLGSTGAATDEAATRYTRTRLHAKGGMGQVWVARDQSLGRQIALKELRPDQKRNSLLLARFLYEAKITAQLEHPGIVPVYELGGGPLPFYTMRFVKGRTLSEAIRAFHKSRLAGAADPLGLVTLLNAFLGVCHAIAYANSKGVIHRDLKGQNIILGDFGEVIVLDWGIAKEVDVSAETSPPASAASYVPAGPPASTLPQDSQATDGAMATLDSSATSRFAAGDSLTRPAPSQFDNCVVSAPTFQGELLGTPGFMAPEQAGGRLDQIDQRTDVYGLGAVLYEILTGVPPFEGKRTIEIVKRVQQEPPKSPRERNPSVDPALQAICLKAISKRKEQRYPSAAELAQEVQRYLADQPVLACPEPWTGRAARWSRKHRGAVITAAALLITSTIALAVGTVLVSRERNVATVQREEARQAVDDMYTKVAENWLEDRLDPLQKEFLQKTLAHYQTLTGQAADSPEVKLEHGRGFQRMGDISRKLGDLDKAGDEYLRALEILKPLLAAQPADPGVRRALALTETRLGDLMLRRGQNNQARLLFDHAIELEQASVAAPDALADDRWLLARTLKSQADLLRLKGDFTGSRKVYGQAIAALEKPDSPSLPSDVQNELALAKNALGQLLLDMGEMKEAESEFRGALAILEPLVSQFPTIRRFLEALATASNSLGLIEARDGRTADCEVQYRRELAEVERLSQDFPDRPEYRREMARASMNLANLLSEEGREAESETLLHRSIALNTDLMNKQPGDVQVRLDLSKARTNLGEAFRANGQAPRSIAEYEKSHALSVALVKQFPDSPRYREEEAGTLVDLGLAYDSAGDPRAEAVFKEALAMEEALVREYADSANYKTDLGNCVMNLGAYEAGAKRIDQAESLYLRGLEVLKDEYSAQALRNQAALYSNLGILRNDAHRPGAEEPLRRSIAISEELAARKPPARTDLVYLASHRTTWEKPCAIAARAKKPPGYMRLRSPDSNAWRKRIRRP
jgi:eukaryotic-like serine/threonine-protein kinase